MPEANSTYVDERHVADDKFGKTREHEGEQDSTTQYDEKKEKADLKKTTASHNQKTV